MRVRETEGEELKKRKRVLADHSRRPKHPLATAVELHVVIEADEDLGASTDSRSPLVQAKPGRDAHAEKKEDKEKERALTASGVKLEKEKAKAAMKPKGQGPPPQLEELPDEVLITLFSWCGTCVPSIFFFCFSFCFLYLVLLLFFTFSHSPHSPLSG